MDFRVLGCHGGETHKHHCPAFLLNGKVCLDAGALTRTLTLKEQHRIETVVVSHAHIDHVRDLAMIADTRTQQGGPPITVVSTPGTIRELKRHFFNGKLWPDFSQIPDERHRTIVFAPVKPGETIEASGHTFRPISVHHTVEAAGFIVSDGTSTLAYSGDTGPTTELWDVINAEKDLSALIMEVAFPNEEQALATMSGHHTPATLEKELRKLKGKHRDLPVLLFHIKPVHQRITEKQLAKTRTRNISILQLADEYVL